MTALIVSDNQAGETSPWPEAEVVEIAVVKGVGSYSGAIVPVH